jgi:TfoX/Sxy family transcriptional regulator of competence genes
MFMGVYQEDIFLRLSKSDRKEFLKLDLARLFEPMPGRPMQEYVILPPRLLKDPARLEKWIEKSLAYVSSLPPKGKKK